MKMNNNVMDYLNAMTQAKNMLNQRIISDEEYEEIERKFAEKYCLNSLSLYRLNDLINKRKRVIDIIQK